MKERILNLFSSVSAGFATLGSSFQLCHSLCLGLMAVLATLGIVIAGFPLLFLFQYNIYFWSFAIALLIPTVIMYIYRKCLSRNLLLFNIGIVIAGTPENFTLSIQPIFWIVGGILVAIAIASIIYKKAVC